MDVADGWYLPAWKRVLPAKSSERLFHSDQKISWLLFLDECGLGARVASGLEREGQRVVTVRIGEKFSRIQDGAYVINPQSRDDYDSLLRELRATENTPARIVHLWNVTGQSDSRRGIELFETHQPVGLYSLLFLIQALAREPNRFPSAIRDHLQSPACAD